jgi:hypothetical protein
MTSIRDVVGNDGAGACAATMWRGAERRAYFVVGIASGLTLPQSAPSHLAAASIV